MRYFAVQFFILTPVSHVGRSQDEEEERQTQEDDEGEKGRRRIKGGSET